ncbi:hypothetical protein GGTG_13588 [Gaeumannomyces tritici R3-111a-1]|uniref:Uncharacterized protein n=1 Tax=Gaeumannomyces tritici (strain R3-111a-1) TaxID=644352 RepID=J3PJA7_GAET3|nr:hypothetical protein GGTG_13588 [Gaeumannomyces tritici R3-111a-1]EJT68835.1 hypothetical protein GGTG_13588 [Gaeumannomyces tritici R3-111a-1]
MMDWQALAGFHPLDPLPDLRRHRGRGRSSSPAAVAECARFGADAKTSCLGVSRLCYWKSRSARSTFLFSSRDDAYGLEYKWYQNIRGSRPSAQGLSGPEPQSWHVDQNKIHNQPLVGLLLRIWHILIAGRSGKGRSRRRRAKPILLSRVRSWEPTFNPQIPWGWVGRTWICQIS